jgi:branched-chain amino acid transport system permease protein
MADVVRWSRKAVLIGGPTLLVAAAAVPLFGDDFALQLGTLVVVYTLAVTGLDVVAGRGGMLHSGFGVVFGVGAYAVTVIAQYWTSPIIVAVIVGACLGGLVSAALGLLLARSSAFMFAVLTLAAATAAASVVNNIEWLGGTSGLAGATRDLFGLGEIGAGGLYVLLWLVTATVAVLYYRFRFSPTGRAIEAMRLVPAVALASGVNISALRVKLSILSGVIGGLGGAFYAVQQQYVSADLLGAIASVNLLAMAIIGGATVALGGLPGAFITVGLPQLFQGLVAYQIILVGVITGMVALWFRRGVAGTLEDIWWSVVKPLFKDKTAGPATTASAPRATFQPESTVLELANATVMFGGVVAVRDVSLKVDSGRVHALVGPNGAGKSTLVGLIAGSVQGIRTGTIRLHGKDIFALPPEQRVAAGVTRTFQLVALCDTLTALENVMLGGHAAIRPSFVRDFFMLRGRAREQQLVEQAASLLSRLGAAGIAHIKPPEMTSGQQRLVEIARCLMTDAQVILLDEPAAGLSSVERRQLAAVVRQLAADGHAVVLIEHDMHFVMSVAQRITVLANGALLADGAPDAVRSDPKVIEAYWGRAAAA